MEHDSLTLAARIEAFELDEPGVVDTFTRRLARDNGWSHAYTLRVVREYKRFLTLAATANHVVSPSEQVDQAWHLHVLHAARYRAFCRDVLGRPLDHGPSGGGRLEQARLVHAYEQTLSSYQRLFDEPAPDDVWPDARRRFGIDLAVRRVNTAEHWIVQKPRPWLWLRARFVAPSFEFTQKALMAGAAVLVCGCRASLSDSASGPAYLRGFLLLWLTTAGIAYLVKKESLKALLSAPVALEPYALAQLVGGSDRVLDGAITSLIASNCVEFERGTASLTAKRAVSTTAPAIEQSVYREIAGAGTLAVQQLRRQATTLSQGLADQLLARGLVTAGRSKLPLLLVLLAPIVGIFRILSRLGTDKPLSLLVVLTLIAIWVAFVNFHPARERTALGDATVAQARKSHEPLKKGATAAALSESGLLPVMLALFGGAAIAGISDWNTPAKSVASASSGGCSSCGGDSGGCGGDSGGCGGDSGGCGGGCGGCGGH